ncbi:hypothetical protein N2152v2_002374 [Parachlorella kessleri]
MPLNDEQREDWASQLDELQALASIYDEDFQLVSYEGVQLPAEDLGTSGASESCVEDLQALAACSPSEEPWALQCSLSIRLSPPGGRLQLQLDGLAGSDGSPGGGTIGNSGGGNSGGAAGFSVRFLPPITLLLRLAPGYPSSHPPQLASLSALWLSGQQAAELRRQLQQLWEEQGPGLPVCFTWADWLQNSSLEHLGAAQTLTLQDNSGSSSSGGSSGGGHEIGYTSDSGMGDGGGDGAYGRRLDSHGGGSVQEGEQPDSGEEGMADTPEQLLLRLLRYDAAQEHQEFQRGMHTCQICFEEQPGTSFVRLDCGHCHFCVGCLREQCHIHVAEGSVELLKCPEPKCGAPLSPQVLQWILPAEEFERWEQLTLQKTLDRMADAAYCPRCRLELGLRGTKCCELVVGAAGRLEPRIQQGRGPNTISLEDSDNCAQCPKCLFVFCSLCMEGWHPGTQCVSAETRLEMLQRKLQGGGALSVQELRRKEQEFLSLATIERMGGKRCPRCSMAIQKSGGCNKMVCGNCGAFFCYKCNKEISGYDHYKDSGCILFDEAEILRWEQQWADQVARVALAEARNDFYLQQQQLALFGGVQAPAPEARAAGGGRERVRFRGAACPQCGQFCAKMGELWLGCIA